MNPRLGKHGLGFIAGKVLISIAISSEAAENLHGFFMCLTLESN